MEQRKQLTFEKVYTFINKRYATNKQVLLTIQFDEFSEVPKPVLNEIISLLGTHVTSEHKLGVCILAQFTGTDTHVGIKEVNSRLLPTPFLLEPLVKGDETELCRVELVVKLQKRLEGMDKEQLKEGEYLEEMERLEFLKNLLDQPLFLQAVDSLGRVPRFLQFFLTKLVTTIPKQDLEEFLSGVMNSVVDEVKTTYGTKNYLISYGID
jgi:hypothetical protein